MKRQILPRLRAVAAIDAAVAALEAVLLTACAQPTDAPEADARPVPAYRIAQEQRGDRVVFAVCSECPQRTPKTLALQVQTAQRDLPSEPQAVPAARPVPSIRVVGATVLFELNSARLTTPAMERLEALAPLLRQAMRVRITGYTDDLGATALNTRLADARALTVMLRVRSALGNDAPSGTLSASGRPLCCYLTDNGSEGRRVPNRRVELAIELPNTEGVDRTVRSLAPHLSEAGLAGAQPASVPPATDTAASHDGPTGVAWGQPNQQRAVTP